MVTDICCKSCKLWIQKGSDREDVFTEMHKICWPVPTTYSGDLRDAHHRANPNYRNFDGLTEFQITLVSLARLDRAVKRIEYV